MPMRATLLVYSKFVPTKFGCFMTLSHRPSGGQHYQKIYSAELLPNFELQLGGVRSSLKESTGIDNGHTFAHAKTSFLSVFRLYRYWASCRKYSHSIEYSISCRV